MKRFMFLLLFLTIWLGLSALRSGPDFIVLGAQKAGSTSLYYYLTQHPDIQPNPNRKEVAFFNINANFPIKLSWYRRLFSKKRSGKLMGEATPQYLFGFPASKEPLKHNVVPQRIKKFFPRTKFIVSLRNPVRRAYSAYQDNVRRSGEKRTFEQCIKKDLSKYGPPRNYWIKRGIYIHQIKQWFSVFDRSQFFIMRFEDLVENPIKIMNEVYAFLGLKPFHNLKAEVVNTSGKYPPMKDETREMLKEYFEPYNRMLENYLGREFHWD